MGRLHVKRGSDNNPLSVDQSMEPSSHWLLQRLLLSLSGGLCINGPISPASPSPHLVAVLRPVTAGSVGCKNGAIAGADVGKAQCGVLAKLTCAADPVLLSCDLWSILALRAIASTN